MGRTGWWMAGVVALVAVAGSAWMAFGRGATASAGAAAAANSASASAAAGAPLEFAEREVVSPRRMALPVVLEFSGPLIAPGTAVVRAKAGGTLRALAVAEGQRVRAGQPLGTIDLSELATRTSERAAQVDAARASLTQAERQHASSLGLAAQQFISPVALENSRAAVETARAQLAAAQASLQAAQVVQREAALVAPISGLVARRHALPGERLAAEQPVLTLVDLARLELAGVVGPHEVVRLRPGQPLQVQIEGLPAPREGRIARIAPAAEPGTRAIGVTVELDNPGEVLRAGVYALARLTLDDGPPGLVLPVHAVVPSGGQDQVWVVEDGRLARRAVTLGRRDPTGVLVEVRAGLAPDATVLAQRFDNLREGAPARVAGR